jgi:hypothetical protein
MMDLLDVESLLGWLIPDPEECRQTAAELRLEDPDATAEEAARRAVRSAKRWAAAMGAATGAAASPITLLPAAVAEAATLLRIEGKMAGVVAALLDPDSLLDPHAFRRDILRVVFPGAFSQALRKIGIRVAENSTKQVIERLVTRGVLKEVGNHTAKWLGVRLTEKAIATKAVPVVGMGIGAVWNWVELQAIGMRAIAYHTGQDPVGEPLRRKVKSWVSKGRTRLAAARNGRRGETPALPGPGTLDDPDPARGDDAFDGPPSE